MKNNKLSRITAETIFDDLVEARNSGADVSLSQIQQADDDFTRAARMENLAELQHRLYACGTDFETLTEARKKARDAQRACLHKIDRLRELSAKIDTYVEGVDLKLNIAAVEESEVLALLEEV